MMLVHRNTFAFALSPSLLIVAALTFGATACQTASKGGPQANSDALRVIDAHTHTRFNNQPEGYTKIMQSKEEYLRERREAGVVASISHTSEDGNGYNADMIEHNVTHCAGLGAKVNTVRLEADLKSGKYKCIKVYLGYVHQWAYDKNYSPAYRLAEKYDVPVIFHTGDTYSTKGKIKYADPLTIDEIAVDFPKVNFVIAHCGNPWIQTAAEVAYKNPNVYLECSALLVGNMDELDPKSVDGYVTQPIKWILGYLENPSKLMYGTDWPLNRMKPYLEAYKRAVPKEHWQAVFHDNAAKLFKIKD
jgi:predicted TIM-barrel fold metal-dependent hydrolase